ncbi:MAG TPA: sulfate adenylyltransferase subunit CysD [Bacteroidetes bacterium]|nr:sulfate adenylyltransferase subunit CysD [Bacteroidota bacterium]
MTEIQYTDYRLSQLAQLESEAIYLIREAAAQFENPVILFSGGKDSITLVHLALKAFWPAKLPFSLLHIDTGHNFPETIAFRDQYVKENGLNLIIRKVQDSIDQGSVTEEKGLNASRNHLQTTTLVDAIEELSIDCAFGGARRDEEKARAKERFFSHRDEFGQWDPKNQRPELWKLFNGSKFPGEHFRVFPLSNWTELDIWMYLAQEKVALPSLYFAHEREVIIRNGTILAVTEFLQMEKSEKPKPETVRFRTIGDATCTGAEKSTASDIEAIIQEVALTHTTERSSRTDDQRSESAMEDRKKQGYF